MERILSQKRMEVSSRTVSLENADSPGSSALAYTVESGRIIGADALGARGRPSEEVGTQVALTFASAIDSGAAVDSNLADMIGPLLSISERESLLKVPNITQHLMTSLHVAKLFTGCQYSWVQDEECFLLSVRPVARQNT
jgi:RNA 3'-terminal phosphate cyclase